MAGDERGPDLADLTWTDLDQPPILLVPVGSCEQHGPHLPIGTDTLIATAIARDVAARQPGRVVAPALAISASGEHQGFPGTLSIGTDVMTTVLVELVRSAGWAERVVFVNGHGGNASALTAAAATIEYESRPAIFWSPDMRPLVSAGLVGAGDLHAGHVETSIMAALHPELVHSERAVPGPSPAPTLAVLARDGVQAVSPNGVIGDPTTASAEAGRRLFAAFADQLAARLGDVPAMTPPRRTRYRLDGSVQRFGRVVIGGSPLKLFRVTADGEALIDRIAAGDAVASSTLVTALDSAGAIHPDPGRGPYTAADVTVVVPCRRSGSGEPVRVPAGALLIDDGSPTPIAGAALRFDTNRGAAAARNAGTGLVATPLVAFVDADVELPDGWLDALLAHFADDRVGLVAPRVRTPGGAGAIARYERDRSPLDLGPEPARVRSGTRVSYVPAAALVCRVAALHDVGGFDEGLRFGEDVDLVWRLDAAGWRCRYEPASEVLHDPRSTWRGWVCQRIGYGSSAAPLARRHPGALAPIRMSGWSVAAWSLAAIGRPVTGAAVGAGSAAALIRKLPDVPPRAAFRLAGLGNLHAGDQISGAIRRAWWPLIAVLALRSRTARRALLAAVLASRHPLRLADDLAYSIGVWKGMLAERTVAPLVPEITSWPGRQSSTARPGRDAAAR